MWIDNQRKMRNFQERRYRNSSSIPSEFYDCQIQKKHNIHDFFCSHIHINEEMCEDERVVVKTIVESASVWLL